MANTYYNTSCLPRDCGAFGVIHEQMRLGESFPPTLKFFLLLFHIFLFSDFHQVNLDFKLAQIFDHELMMKEWQMSRLGDKSL